MYELVQTVINSEEKRELGQFLSKLHTSDQHYFLRNEILQVFAEYCSQSQKPAYFYHSSSLGTLIHHTHEIIFENAATWFVVRPNIASQEVWKLTADLNSCSLMSPQSLLDVCDRLVNQYQSSILEIDLHPFYESSPKITDARNIGQGLAFLNHYLCEQVVHDPKYWLEILFQALRQIEYNGTRLLISDRISSGIQLPRHIKQSLQFLNQRPAEEPYSELRSQLEELGLAAGWGNNAGRIRETLALLEKLIDSPHPNILEAFVARIPAIFRIVLISIHGWVGQEDVIGRDETLSQVIYVLEQARNLEAKLRAEIQLAGLDIQPHIIILTRLIPNCEGTFCNLRIEKVAETENTWIVRIPFQESHPEITNNWISKFEIWPYLEQFALDAEQELLTQFRGKPNLIIGNYSDGNLVAFLLSRRLGVTQCNIAHSLEKPKYLFSNLYWQKLESQYHFSTQFTADLISMNAADFIVASSYQEIVGTPDSFGQYESYKCFTMPQLYHVVDGIDLFSPKFNMVPPGINENIFFPNNHITSRNPDDTRRVHDLLFTSSNENIDGYLDAPDKRPIFSVTSINSIKNLTGLVECFGQSKALQERCNLILLTSKLHIDDAANQEEIYAIQQLNYIIEQYHLEGKIRWIGMRLLRREIAEAYRIIADYQGIYVYFALFESFGISIVEAMISGLPTFATKFGGALEIIDDQEHKFILNPTNLEHAADKIFNFIEQCHSHPHYWLETSQNLIERIQHKYNWKNHTNQLLNIAKVVSFWNLVFPAHNEARDRYMEALFHLVYKPRAENILQQHLSRK
ncbi:sucrose synthase [Richelia sinica]|nr:sucrose synthase [Richelia sinica]MBD2667415.1 sucrose synthase [Richelia sinica FACHB-800]